MKDKKTKILTLLTIILIIVIVGVVAVLVVNKKDDSNNNNNNNSTPPPEVVFNRDTVYEYATLIYNDIDYKITIEENDEDFIATVKDNNDNYITKLIFNKKDKSVIKDSSDNAMSGGAGYDPSLEENGGDVNE